jgi:hypothetical protein
MPITQYRQALEVAQQVINNNLIAMWGSKDHKPQYESSYDMYLRARDDYREHFPNGLEADN